jgi:hypothetical protein
MQFVEMEFLLTVVEGVYYALSHTFVEKPSGACAGAVQHAIHCSECFSG